MFILDDVTLEEIANGFHIPAKPQALKEIQQLNIDGDYDLNKAADIVSKDVELSGLIIKAINSPFFGLTRKIADIRQAAVVLGFKNIYQITTACLLKNAFKEGDSCLALERFWDEAIETATLCSKLTTIESVSVNPADAYALGLFHDCGIAAMSLKYDDYEEVLDRANTSTSLELDVIEEQSYGTSHTQVGYVIAKSWSVPENICEIIARHHEADLFGSLKTKEQVDLAALLFVAQNIVGHRHNKHNLPMWEKVKPAVLDVLAMSDKDYVKYLEELKI